MKMAPAMYEFFVEGSDQALSHALLHITEPSTDAEWRKGHFFAVAEINHGTTDLIEHLQRLIDSVETAYYADPVTTGDPFERAIEQANKRGHRLLTSSASVHCLIGVLRQGQASFVMHGKPTAQLFYRSGGGFAHTTITDEDAPTGQLFSSILQGTVNPADRLWVSTPSTGDYFSGDRISKLLETRTDEQTAKHVEKGLADTQSGQSFAGILFSIPTKAQGDGSAESLTHLVKEKAKTEEILSPPVLGDTGKKLKALLAEPEAPTTSKRGGIRTTGTEPSVLNTILVGFGRALTIALLGVWNVIKSILIGISTIGRYIWYLTTNQGGRRRDVIASWQRFWRDKRHGFVALPLMSKILLVAAIVCAVIFAGSITYLKMRERQAAAQAQYKDAVASVRDRKAAADGSLIYGNDDKAFSLVRDAQATLATLPNNSKEEKETKQVLTKELEETLNKLRKIVTVSSAPFFDFDKQFPTANVQSILRFDDSILAYGPDDQSLYAIRLLDHSATSQSHETIPHIRAGAVPKEQDMAAFLYDDKSIASMDKTTFTLSSKDISPVASASTFTDLVVYNQRLYILDGKAGAIYRHNKTQTGYDRGSVWNKTNGDLLVGGRSIAIDGDVFTLTASSVVKFAGGVFQPFSITGLDPELTDATEIYTYTDTKYIYILESKTKRFIELDKNGKLIAQFTDPAWRAPSSFIVDESKRIVYILDGHTILQFSIK